MTIGLPPRPIFLKVYKYDHLVEEFVHIILYREIQNSNNVLNALGVKVAKGLRHDVDLYPKF